MKKISLLLFLFVTVLLSCCKKEMPEPPTEQDSNTSTWGSSYNEYHVTFFTTSNLAVIGVNFNSMAQDITYYYNYNPGCGANGCANFTVPPGSYFYSASSGRTGTINTGASQCITIQL